MNIYNIIVICLNKSMFFLFLIILNLKNNLLNQLSEFTRNNVIIFVFEKKSATLANMSQ